MTGRELIVHAGTFKTGTSRIQNLAWAQRDALLDQGVLYPRTGLVLDEPDIGFRHAHLVYLHGTDPARWRMLIDELSEEIAASGAERVLLSSEGWSRPGFVPTLVAVIDGLRSSGAVEATRAVMYVRNRLDYARSLHREFARRQSNRLRFAEFTEVYRRPLDLLDAAEAVAATVDRLDIHPYEDCGDVGRHFFTSVGVALSSDAYGARDRVNTGITASDAEALRQLNLVAADLAEAWPLGAVDEDVVEVAQPGQFDADPHWRARFAALSGWSEPQLDRMLDVPAESRADISTCEGEIGLRVRTWLTENTEPDVDVTTYPNPVVEAFEVRPVQPKGDRPWITGFLMLAAGESGWRLIGVDDFNERDISVDRPSPKFAAKHPQRPEAATARWGSINQSFGSHGRIDLHLVHEDGRRILLATLRRRYRLRG